MTEEKRPPSLADLGARLRQARAREKALGNTPPIRLSGIGIAFRAGVELVAGIAVGAGIGLLFDHFAGTSPWGLVVFCVLGWGAGVLNVYRFMVRMEKTLPSPDNAEGGAGRRDED